MEGLWRTASWVEGGLKDSGSVGSTFVCSVFLFSVPVVLSVGSINTSNLFCVSCRFQSKEV